LGNKHDLFEYLEERRKYFGQQSFSWPPKPACDASGNPMYSWRMQVEVDLGPPGDGFVGPYVDGTKDWQSQDPRLLLERNPFDLLPDAPSLTHIYGVTGPGSAFDETQASSYSDLPDNLIVLIEAGDSKTIWMQPGDYDVITLHSYTGRIAPYLCAEVENVAERKRRSMP
jgi:hypothetical protein